MDKTEAFLCGIVVGMLILFGISLATKPKVSQPETRLEECFVVAPRIPYYPEIYTLGGLMGRISFCESSGNPEAYNPKSGAKGLFQIIPSSERFCEKGLGRELDMFNESDNIDCARYLMRHGGLSHWESSANCWK